MFEGVPFAKCLKVGPGVRARSGESRTLCNQGVYTETFGCIGKIGEGGVHRENSGRVSETDDVDKCGQRC